MAISVIGSIHYIFSTAHQVEVEDCKGTYFIFSITCWPFDLILSMCFFPYILNGKVILKEKQFLTKPPPDLCLFKCITKLNQNI